MENDESELKAERFAEKVRAIVAARGLTYATVARRMGRHPNVVTRWVGDNKLPKIDGLFQMARALGVSMEYLIDDAMDEPGRPSGGGALSEDEAAIVRICRAYNLTLEEFARRTRYQAGERPEGPSRAPAGEGGSADAPDEVPPVPSADFVAKHNLDLIAESQRQEERRKDQDRGKRKR